MKRMAKKHRRDLRALLDVLRAYTHGTKVPASPFSHEATGRMVSGLPWHDPILGYGLAEKRTDGVTTGELSLRFYVRHKIPRGRLKSGWRIPRQLQIGTRPGESFRLTTDVIEMKTIPSMQRTVSAGDSISHRQDGEGTLGLVVTDGAGQRYLLTCSHVAAPPWAASGDAEDSPADGQTGGGLQAGTLFGWSRLDAAGENRLDAALVKPIADTSLQLTNSPLRLGASPAWSDVTPEQFNAVQNRSVSCYSQSGEKPGTIDSLANDIPFLYGPNSYRFFDVGGYNVNCEDGDSGAAVVDAETRQVYGLHFAGQEAQQKGYFILGTFIRDAFKVSIAPD